MSRPAVALTFSRAFPRRLHARAATAAPWVLHALAVACLASASGELRAQPAPPGPGEARVERAASSARALAGRVATPAPAPDPLPSFEVREGERLSVALTRYLAARGWDLEWSAPGDFVVERAYGLPLGDLPLPQALQRVLAPYRLSAVLHEAPLQRVVDVTIAEPPAGAAS